MLYYGQLEVKDSGRSHPRSMYRQPGQKVNRLVALMPAGMSQVRSVNFETDVEVGATFNKGDMLGYFLFGGSDFVMLFQAEAGFMITAPQTVAMDTNIGQWARRTAHWAPSTL
jgi:hypothetical protein